MRPRFVQITALAALLAALAILSGCGGSGDDAGGTAPAQAAPAGAPVFIEGTIQPDSEIAANVDSLAKQVAGIDDVGALIAEELEKSAADDGDDVDFEKEVEPWLGDRAAIFLREYDGEDFQGGGGALQVSDEAEAEDFVEANAKDSGESYDEGSYEGVDFDIGEDGATIGFTEGLLLYGEDEAVFKQMVDALDGENLESDEAFTEASGEVPDDSVAHVFVDVGGLIEEAGAGIPPETKLGFDVLGIDPEEATALVSLVPGSDRLEMDISSDLASNAAAGGDASAILGSLPAGSVAALSSAEYGKSLQAMIDQIDEDGIPGEIPPHQFKKALESTGISVEKMFGDIGDIGVFVEGNSERNLGGALVIESKDATRAENTVKNLGLLLRSSDVPGVTAIREDGASGFSVRSEDIPKPIVTLTDGSKIVVAYGPKAAAAALSEKAGTLADDPAFGEAKAALGDTPITAFVAGPSALTLFDALASPLDSAKLDSARPYLEKIGYVAIGGTSSGDKTTAKVVAGLAK